MLKKLIKHEWKAVWKLLTIINIMMLCLTAVGGFGVLFLNQFYDTDAGGILEVLAGLYIFTYFFAIFAVSIVTLIYLGVRYFKSMYGDEGYLTNTLPATPIQLIASKAIVAVIWYVIYFVVMIVSILSLVLCIMSASGEAINMAELWEGLGILRREMIAAGLSPFGVIILSLAVAIMSCISSILMIYASAAIGQLFDKHRILGAVGVYFAINVIFQIVISIAMAIIISMGFNETNTFYLTTWLSFGGATLIAGVSFLITYMLTTKKLNLE